MLDFPCHSCGHRFSFPEDHAGRDVQCPDCGTLLSVPFASDLAGINPDGTIKVADDPYAVPGATARRADPGRFDELRRAFGTNTVDPVTGEEIDNRTRAEDLELAPMPEPPRSAPVYDPETGELIRPLLVVPRSQAAAPGATTAAVPGAPDFRPAVGYRVEPVRRVPPEGVFADLLRPMNVVVMGVVLALHAGFAVSGMVVNMGMIFVAVAPILLAIVLMGHWGNVVDEIATEDQDELPRPLRSVSFYDDLWNPAVGAGIALLPVVLPTWFLVRVLDTPDPHTTFGGVATGAVVVATAVAILVAPAILLTKVTSGTWANLRPDRVLGTALAGGADYCKAALLGLVALPLYLYGWGVSVYALIKLMSLGEDGLWGQPWSLPLAVLVLVAGVYLMHAFCWRLGLVYRSHYRQFPWVGQERILADRAVPKLSPEARRRLLERKQAILRGDVLVR